MFLHFTRQEGISIPVVKMHHCHIQVHASFAQHSHLKCPYFYMTLLDIGIVYLFDCCKLFLLKVEPFLLRFSHYFRTTQSKRQLYISFDVDPNLFNIKLKGKNGKYIYYVILIPYTIERNIFLSHDVHILLIFLFQFLLCVLVPFFGNNFCSNIRRMFRTTSAQNIYIIK